MPQLEIIDTMGKFEGLVSNINSNVEQIILIDLRFYWKTFFSYYYYFSIYFIHE